MAVVASIVWRRVDLPGHDACYLEPEGSGWRLHGTAVFKHVQGPSELAYAIRCDEGWHTLEGRVRGNIGGKPVLTSITRTARGWSVNGTLQPDLEGLTDLDLGFTPATNLPHMRRHTMHIGERVDAPVAWFDVDTGTLAPLPQFYERRGNTIYWYEAPTNEYEGRLEMAPNGFIRHYPQLWEAEAWT